MSLTNYKPQFDNAYQEVFQKVLVAKAIANLRFEPTLTFGEYVERVAYDISGVKVRTVVRNSASTIDAVTDTSETLLINLEKEAVFEISDGEVKQAGPLNPGAEIGGKIAQKVAEDFDARIFAEVANAYQTFDNGDLTTLASDLTPITLSSTTVPQMVTRMPAKLRYGAKQTLTNLAMVIDSYAAADIAQYLLGKQFDVVNAIFKNGYAEGQVAGAEVYISENLTGSAVLTATDVFTDGQTITINGVVFTTKTALSSGPAVAGEVVIGANYAATLTNLAAAINAPSTTTATFTALSAADAAMISETLRLAATAGATTLTIVGTGSGRLIVAETQTNAAWSKNHIKSFFGKKGAIDAVLQDMKEVDMRPCSDRRATNVFSSYLGGIKTFADGAKKMLQVKIAC
jgi:hypothetical protein